MKSYEYDQVLNDIRHALVTTEAEASGILKIIGAQLDQILNATYKEKQAKLAVQTTMLTESTSKLQPEEKYVESLQKLHQKLEKQNEEIKSIQAQLDMTLGNNITPESKIQAAESAKKLNDDVLKLAKHSQKLTELQKDDIRKTFNTGYLPPGTDPKLIETSIKKLELSANNLYESVNTIKQQAKDEKKLQDRKPDNEVRTSMTRKAGG